MLRFFGFLLVLALSLSMPVLANESPPFVDTYEIAFSKLANWDRHIATIAPLGEGRSNCNYLLTIGDERYFVRTGSASRQALGISAERESEATQLGASLGLTLPILVVDPAKDLFIRSYIDAQIVNMRDSQQLIRAIDMLRRLHESNSILSTTTTPEEIISFYLQQIEKLNIPLTEHQRELIAARPIVPVENLVPCHLSFNGQNILDDGSKLWLIDWEYGAMSDPLFDLATLAPADEFSDEEMANVLSLYIESPSKEVQQRFYKLRILADLRIALWALIELHTSNLDRPYKRWAEESFDEVERRIGNLEK